MKEIHFHLIKRVSIVEKYNFYEYLSVMIEGGVTLSEALVSVQSKLKNHFFKEKVKELYTYVASWDSFTKSMKKIPVIFWPSEIAIIESWEAIGRLSQSFSNLSDSLRKTHDLQLKIKWALAYPLIIFVFLIIAVIIVLTYVIPSISVLFESTQVALPLATQALIATSEFFIHKWYILLFFTFTLWVLFFWYKNTESWKLNIDNFLLTLPLFWKVYKNYLLAGFSRTLWTLVSSGVSIVKSLSLSSKWLGNLVYEGHINTVIQKVSQGQKIVESMQEVDPENQLFPLDFLQMLSVWEKTASLEMVTKKLAIQYTREVDYSLTNLTKWIEPIAILIAGSFVLWFAFAIFWAILKVTETVN